MRAIRELHDQERTAIIAIVQTLLYLDRDREGRQFWNPDKEWSGADGCESLAGLLSQYDLAPQERLSLDGVPLEFD